MLSWPVHAYSTNAAAERRGRRFLLVTGMPRSGTTGVGNALAHAPGASSLYEPLNPESGLTSVRDYFVPPPRSTLSSDPTLTAQLDQVWRVSVRMRRGIWPHDPTWKKLVKQATGSTSRVSAARIRLDPRVRTVVWKDPFASFLAPALVAELGIPVVVTVRPPEAAAASFKRLAWSYDVGRLARELAQRHPGAPFVAGVETLLRGRADPVGFGAHLWRLLYGHLDHEVRQRGIDTGLWWVNSRAVLEDPVGTYTRLYDDLGLALTPAARAAIVRDYRDEGSAQPAGGVTHDRGRNVQQANGYWSQLLTPEEQRQVHDVTGDVRVLVERHTGPL